MPYGRSKRVSQKKTEREESAVIYTVTLNPSVDFIRRIENMHIGEINYSTDDRMSAGGRAIMVSRMLHRLSIPTTATGFVGGHTGSYIEEELDREGILHDFIRTQSNTRLNLSLFVDDVETRILGRGGEIRSEEINDLLYYLSRIREGDYLVVAGSLPPGMSTDIYERMFEIATVNGATFLPIISPEPLKQALVKKPLLIAPTMNDLRALFSVEEISAKEAVDYAKRLLSEGAQNVLINRERMGSLFITGDGEVYQANGPEGAIVSATYTNMALIAGFIGNYMRTNDAKKAFPAAQGCANATYGVETLPSLAMIRHAITAVQVTRLA